MIRFRHVPLIAGLSIIGAAVGYTAFRSAVEVDLDGVPLRANSYSVSCPRCQFFDQRTNNPSYYGTCPQCGLQYKTWLDENRRIVVEPVQ